MSVKVMGAVWELDLPHAEKLVLLAMADHADHDGRKVFPSIDLVAWKAGYSRRQVQRIIKALLVRGILAVEAPATYDRPTIYRIHTEQGKQQAPFAGRDRLDADERNRVIAELIQLNGARCHICGQRGSRDLAPDGQAWHVDRLIPAHVGGRYEWGNMDLACGICNRRKGGAKMASPVKMAPHDKRDSIGVPSATKTGATDGTLTVNRNVKETSDEIEQFEELDFIEVALHRRFKRYLALGGWRAPKAPTFTAAEIKTINESGLTKIAARQASKDGLWPPGESS